MVLALEILGGAGVDPDTIRRIGRILESNGRRLRASKPAGLPERAFGGSMNGLDLDTQTSTAYQHVVEAIEEMVAGLEGYATNVIRFGDDITGTDEEVQAQLARGTREAEAYSSTDNFHDNGIAPPAPGGEAAPGDGA
ncbi:MAG: hypothetical protein WBP61_10785 [Nocardioides sp.]